MGGGEGGGGAEGTLENEYLRSMHKFLSPDVVVPLLAAEEEHAVAKGHQ